MPSSLSWALNPVSAYLPSPSPTSSSKSSAPSQRPSSFLWYVAPVRWLYPQPAHNRRKASDDAQYNSNGTHAHKPNMSSASDVTRSPSPSVQHSPSIPSTSLQHRALTHTNHRKESLDSLNKLKQVMPNKLKAKHLSKRRHVWTPTEVVIYMAVCCTILSCAVWSYRIINEALATLQRYRTHEATATVSAPVTTRLPIQTTLEHKYSYVQYSPPQLSSNAPYIISLFSTNSDCQADAQHWKSVADTLRFNVVVPCETESMKTQHTDYGHVVTELYRGVFEPSGSDGRLYLAVSAYNGHTDVLMYELPTAQTASPSIQPNYLCSVVAADTASATVAPGRNGRGIALPKQLTSLFPCTPNQQHILRPTSTSVIQSAVKQLQQKLQR